MNSSQLQNLHMRLQGKQNGPRMGLDTSARTQRAGGPYSVVQPPGSTIVDPVLPQFKTSFPPINLQSNHPEAILRLMENCLESRSMMNEYAALTSITKDLAYATTQLTTSDLSPLATGDLSLNARGVSSLISRRLSPAAEVEYIRLVLGSRTTPLVHPSLPVPSSAKPLPRSSTTNVGIEKELAFPEKLHRLLCDVEFLGRSDVISFLSDDTFRIHDPLVFFHSVLPQYFRQTKLSSFKRQLKLYGFELMSKGPTIGGYRHKLFSKKNPLLCREMKRVAIKSRPTKR